MNEQEVIELMRSSKSREEWNANCDKIKSICNGYPSFWYKAIVISGLASDTASKWKGDAQIHITVS